MGLHSDQHLRVVVYRDEGVFIAQCLELDVAAHGDTADEALQAFHLAVVRNLAVARHLGTEPFAHVGEAPREFFDMWDQLCAAGRERRPIPVPNDSVAEAVCA